LLPLASGILCVLLLGATISLRYLQMRTNEFADRTTAAERSVDEQRRAALAAADDPERAALRREFDRVVQSIRHDWNAELRMLDVAGARDDVAIVEWSVSQRSRERTMIVSGATPAAILNLLAELNAELEGAPRRRVFWYVTQWQEDANTSPPRVRAVVRGLSVEATP
jgi:hypothetical protein